MGLRVVLNRLWTASAKKLPFVTSFHTLSKNENVNLVILFPWSQWLSIIISSQLHNTLKRVAGGGEGGDPVHISNVSIFYVASSVTKDGDFNAVFCFQ